MSERSPLPPQSQDDEPSFGDLSALDLEALDLEGFGEEAQAPLWRTLYPVALLLVGGLVLWVPTTEWFQLQGQNSLLFFVLCGGGIVDGILLGRVILRWAEAAGARREAERPTRERTPPSPLWRWLTLLVALCGGAAIVFGVPASAYYSNGDAYHSTWFLGAGGALVVGVLLGRWLLMQANAAPVAARPREPIKLPPWFKWVTLGALVVVGSGVLIANVFYATPDASGPFEFTVGAVGFAVGLAGAIWLARRFDELERREDRQAGR